ncbi:hypothetical protein GCM10023208_23670 [Erythrobacter westpacificensis]|uniref:Uncharacterized protein n=1 Tax=Erythrobacter westpacificensis TaxID=1055231 RepID=A0ABP9KJ92_9SPHN
MSAVLRHAHGITMCLAASFDGQEGEIAAMVDSYKSAALEGIGDLLSLARILCENE